MLIKRIGPAELAELNKDYAGKPDPFSEQLETAPENPKAAEAREELKRWHRFPGQPWTPPDTLTEAAIDVLADQTNIGLDHAINLMVFGQIDPNPPDDIETRARRQQALNAICNSKKFSFIQDRTLVNVPEDTPQSLWPATKIREAAEFVAWLRQCCGAPQPEKQSSQYSAEQEFHEMSLHGCSGKKMAAVFNAMKEVWPNLRVEKKYSIKEIENKIGGRMVRRQFAATGHDHDIRRVLGLKPMRPKAQ